MVPPPIVAKKATGEVGFERFFLLPYSPELNPCERVFEGLRAQIEGIITEIEPSH